MSVQTVVAIDIASVEVNDEYDVEVTLINPHTRAVVTVSMSPDQAAEHATEVRDAAARAREDRAADEVAARDRMVQHGFDQDGEL